MTTQTSLPQGVAWSLSSRVVAQVIQFITSVALARLLAPEAFGLVGMVATVTAFLALFVDCGLGIAVVQRKELDDEHLGGAFIVTIAAGTVVSAVIVALAPWVARFYGAESLTNLTRVSAASVLISSAAIVPRALLVRRARLGTLALVDLGMVVLSAASSVGLAAAGAGVWALVVPGIVTTAATSVLLFVTAHWRPRLGASWAGARPLLAVGLNMLAFNAVNYWARTADNVLIGAWIGERELGLYLRAYGLMTLPLSELTAVLTSAVLPALSRIQHDPAAVRASYLKAVGVVGLVSLPAMIGLALVAHPLVIVLFGPAWIGVAPMLQVLALVGAIQTIVSPVGWIYISQGRTDLMFRWGVFWTIATVAALAYGASLGSGVDVARMYLLVNIALFVPAYLYAGRVVGLRVRELFAAMLPTVIATGAMALCVLACRAALPVTLHAGIRLSVLVAAGVVSYVVASRLVRNRAADDALDLVLEMRPTWRRWARPIAALLTPRRRDVSSESQPG